LHLYGGVVDTRDPAGRTAGWTVGASESVGAARPHDRQQLRFTARAFWCGGIPARDQLLAEWTATFLDEGDAKLVERNGIATQRWATRHLYDDRIALCVGLGAYFTIERGPLESSDRLPALTTGSYAVTPRWLVRVSWNRVFADQRDTDVLLAGIGYMF
jgi:hypothetical protein